MKELKEFTVERLEQLSSGRYSGAGLGARQKEVLALAKIALAAKQAQIVAWEVKGIFCHTKEEASIYVGEPEPPYDAPPLNHTEQHMVVPDGWIKCSERMPEPYAEIVIRTSHGEVIAGETNAAGFLDLHDGTLVKILEANHWMPLPAAPKPEM